MAVSTRLTPLTEMGEETYKGEDGGPYGDGRNQPPAAHKRAAAKEAARITPLDAEGTPSTNGKIVLLSIGMSNTRAEFSQFIAVAERDPEISPHIVIINGAQGGQAASDWADPDQRHRKEKPSAWLQLDRHLESAGVSLQQVQVVWIKHAERLPAKLGEFPAHARTLKENLVTILNMLKTRFPNLRIVFLSSRTYAGYATTPLNPEPYAYESAFAVRWIIQEQINGDPKLNYDLRLSDAVAPLLLWGPYLWADGPNPRKADGLTWKRGDFANDGTHPSISGREKVASLLLGFLKTNDSARRWFLKKTGDTNERSESERRSP